MLGAHDRYAIKATQATQPDARQYGSQPRPWWHIRQALRNRLPRPFHATNAIPRYRQNSAAEDPPEQKYEKKFLGLRARPNCSDMPGFLGTFAI